MSSDTWYSNAFYWYLLAPEGSQVEADWLEICQYWQSQVLLDDILVEANGVAYA